MVAAPLALWGQAPPQGSPSAILHTQGGVWVNGAEARDSTAIFAGDLLETKPGFSATLTLDGSEVLIAAESIAKFDGDVLALDHGSVSVGTSKSYKVRVNCLTVVPALNAWTQYEVSDLSGIIQVIAKKSDVNVQHGGGNPAAEAAGALEGSVHEGEQKSYSESEQCGTAKSPVTPGSGVNPKWIAAAGGAALLILILAHGHAGSSSISPSTP